MPKIIIKNWWAFSQERCQDRPLWCKCNVCCLLHSCVLMQAVKYIEKISGSTLNPQPIVAPPVSDKKIYGGRCTPYHYSYHSLKQTASTAESPLSPRNTKRISVGHCFRAGTSHRLTLCQKQFLKYTGLKAPEVSYSYMLPSGSFNYLTTSPADLVLVAMGGVESGKLCWRTRAILDLTQLFHGFHPPTGH